MIQYHIYSNDGNGGPVDYVSPIATTASLTLATPSLDIPSDTTFVVRSYDTVSSLEDQNTDARVRIVIDTLANDVTSLPAPPWGLSAVTCGSGQLRVSWMYGTQTPAPTGFHVYLGSPAPNYATPAADVRYVPGSPGMPYTVVISGLTGGTTYAVAVRAFSGSGEEANTSTVQATAVTVGPDSVVSLSGSVGP